MLNRVLGEKEIQQKLAHGTNQVRPDPRTGFGAWSWQQQCNSVVLAQCLAQSHKWVRIAVYNRSKEPSGPQGP